MPPESRRKLIPLIAKHLDRLSEELPSISSGRLPAITQLGEWIAAASQQGNASVIVVCTGNSRRSVLGAMMAQVAADYCGVPHVKTFSGGTAPSAFNLRTIRTLREIGFQIEPTGNNAIAGPKGEANPCYRVRWQAKATGDDLSGETLEFSKRYSDDLNPKRDFAAIMVCTEADLECPTVSGAALRIPLPFEDPKEFDGTPVEVEKYAERRDEIGRVMLAAMMNAASRLASKTTSK